MGDMHEAECQDELEKRASCHRRDGQKTVRPPPLTLPLLHARYFLAIVSPQVGSFFAKSSGHSAKHVGIGC